MSYDLRNCINFAFIVYPFQFSLITLIYNS